MKVRDWLEHLDRAPGDAWTAIDRCLRDATSRSSFGACRSDRDDAAQVVMMSLYVTGASALRALPPHVDLGVWCAAAIRRRAATEARSRRRALSDRTRATCDDPDSAPARSVGMKCRADVERLLSSGGATRAQLDAYDLVIVRGMTFYAAGCALGVDRKSVWSRLARLGARLRARAHDTRPSGPGRGATVAARKAAMDGDRDLAAMIRRQSEGHSYREIAEEFGRTRGAVAKRLWRATRHS